MSESRPAREQDRFIVRMPDGMRDLIASRAKANYRSMNSEIVAMLMQVLGNPDELEINDLEARLEQAEVASIAAAAAYEEADRRRFALADELEARRARMAGRGDDLTRAG